MRKTIFTLLSSSSLLLTATLSYAATDLPPSIKVPMGKVEEVCSDVLTTGTKLKTLVKVSGPDIPCPFHGKFSLAYSNKGKYSLSQNIICLFLQDRQRFDKRQSGFKKV